LPRLPYNPFRRRTQPGRPISPRLWPGIRIDTPETRRCRTGSSCRSG
jgi:hypothetical protein